MDYFLQLSWLSMGINSGSVDPGEFIDIPMIFDTEGLPGGDYTADIIINSNDLDEPETTVPVHIFVDGPVFAPPILNIPDIPNDQGGRVYVQFKKSYFVQKIMEFLEKISFLTA